MGHAGRPNTQSTPKRRTGWLNRRSPPSRPNTVCTWPDFTAMRQLAMRIRGLLRSSDMGRLIAVNMLTFAFANPLWSAVRPKRARNRSRWAENGTAANERSEAAADAQLFWSEGIIRPKAVIKRQAVIEYFRAGGRGSKSPIDLRTAGDLFGTCHRLANLRFPRGNAG